MEVVVGATGNLAAVEAAATEDNFECACMCVCVYVCWVCVWVGGRMCACAHHRSSLVLGSVHPTLASLMGWPVRHNV